MLEVAQCMNAVRHVQDLCTRRFRYARRRCPDLESGIFFFHPGALVLNRMCSTYE